MTVQELATVKDMLESSLQKAITEHQRSNVLLLLKLVHSYERNILLFAKFKNSLSNCLNSLLVRKIIDGNANRNFWAYIARDEMENNLSVESELATKYAKTPLKSSAT